MAKEFGENERRICSLFEKGTEFEYEGETYRVLENADKPTCSKGEPKTDIFIRTINLNSKEQYDFKVSYKQSNADFLENKTNAERAELLLGDEWKEIIEASTLTLKDTFESKKLIFKDKFQKTRAGSITLGWKFELLRVKSGELSEKLDLSYDQKVDVYAGTHLPDDKRNSYINGSIVKDSGVAEYVFEESNYASRVCEAVEQFKTIPEYLDDYPDIYYACKALNYRTYEQKDDGNRPLSVYVDWHVTDGKLDYDIVYDAPLVTGGKYAREKLLAALLQLGAKSTDDLNEDNVVDYEKIVYENNNE